MNSACFLRHITPLFDGFAKLWARLAHGGPSVVEDQAVHVLGQIDERDLGLGAVQADGADGQAHDCLLLGEHLFDPGADLGLRGIPAPDMLRHRLAPGLAAMDAADPALRFSAISRWPGCDRQYRPRRRKPCCRSSPRRAASGRRRARRRSSCPCG